MSGDAKGVGVTTMSPNNTEEEMVNKVSSDILLIMKFHHKKPWKRCVFVREKSFTFGPKTMSQNITWGRELV